MHAPADLPPPSSERLQLMLGAKLSLLSVADRLRQNWAAHAAAVGLSPAQVTALLTLIPGEAAPMRSLAARLDYDASNLSVLIDRLEHRGAVERRTDPGDRRVKALVLTPEGERLRAAFWRALTEDPGPLSPLSDTDLRGLAQILDATGAGAPGAADAAEARPGWRQPSEPLPGTGRHLHCPTGQPSQECENRGLLRPAEINAFVGYSSSALHLTRPAHAPRPTSARPRPAPDAPGARLECRWIAVEFD